MQQLPPEHFAILHDTDPVPSHVACHPLTEAIFESLAAHYRLEDRRGDYAATLAVITRLAVDLARRRN